MANRRVPWSAFSALAFGALSRDADIKAVDHPLDCETAFYQYGLPPIRQVHRRAKDSLRRSGFIPVLFQPSDKPDTFDILLVTFGALAIEQVTGFLATSGLLVYGEVYRRKIVRIKDHIIRTRQIIESIGVASGSDEAPQLVLNRHCAICDFQPRCRRVAMEYDDLSLITSMTAKDRAKYHAKGITTVAQLSFGYRPRRRKRTRPDAQSATKSSKLLPPKNDYKLRALAIKKSQIHVVGTPLLAFDGTPTFLDVEGVPDRAMYYLIGIRFERRGEQVEHSFWADGRDGEGTIWENCLQALKAIGDAQVVSYGAYETRFLRLMKERYVSAPEDVEFVDRLIANSVNLLGYIYGKVYFPTFSNSLKEVGRYLGFEWTWPRASGAAALLLRRAWELSSDDRLKLELIDYNRDDCRAAAVVAHALVRLGGGDGVSELDSVDVGSLEVGFQRTFGKFDCALPEFAKINDAAYWDYQRSKVYVRSDKTIRKTVRKFQRRSALTSVEKEVIFGEIPRACPRCLTSPLWKLRDQSQVVYDVKFLRKGVKRWVVRYRYIICRCSRCGAEISTYARPSPHGPALQAFIIYLLIELRLSNQKAAEHVASLFDIPVTKSNIFHIKEKMAEEYLPTYRCLLSQIASGTLVHADETKGVVKGGGHYIWVFTNMTTVVYVYAESREAAILEEVLQGFSGVLVSDFYAAYDSLPCAQQKCLIHLMRDINEDLHMNPFDNDLKEIANRFGALLRQIVETIDMHGLKARYLRQHRRSAEKFIEHVVAMKCSTEAGLALKKRIDKNRDKLFTFLKYNGVPWNNNNAEHAVRAFTRLRNVINTSTAKGTREYATLLSIQQTLQYRGKSFLEFLQSGRKDINRYS